METIYGILDQLHEAKENTPDVLATIIKVKGSAYRKEGTTMLIKNSGSHIGLLSAGCLEEDLIARIQTKRHSKESETIKYDMSSEDDLSWGQGAGCNGVLYVLLETVTPQLHSHLLTLKKHLKSGLAVSLIKKLDKNLTVTDYLFSVENGTYFGEWSSNISLAEKLFRHKNQNGLVYLDNLPYFIQSIQPIPRLILFGAGDDAIPLVKFAAGTGFSVMMTDWREGLCKQSRFPHADQLQVGTPQEIIGKISFTSYDSVIILSHVFQKDKEFLQLVKEKDIRFIGILGSKTRTSRLVHGMNLKKNIYSPVGLPIGAEGPEEIAISIIAQLIKMKRNLS